MSGISHRNNFSKVDDCGREHSIFNPCTYPVCECGYGPGHGPGIDTKGAERSSDTKMFDRMIILASVFPDAPVPGARKVVGLKDGAWNHCGWLLPKVG